MPARFDYTARAYRISCTACGESVLVDSIQRESRIVGSSATRDGHTVREGELATEWIGWHSGHGRFVTRCRDCERMARASRPRAARQTRRVPGMFRALGVERRFGVELELIFPNSVDRYDIDAKLAEAGLAGWRCKSDSSLRGNGWEVVSPVLAGENGLEQIRTACRVVRELGATVNRSCGMHVHHEIRDLTVDGVKQVFRNWSANQPLIDGLVAESRRGRQQYCGTLRDDELRQVENARDLRTIGQFYRFYSNLNLGAYGRYGTIEIRQHQGTANAEKVISWVRFGQAMIERAAEQSTAGPVEATTSARMRDLLSGLGERLDETARTFLLGRTVEFGAVAA